MEIVRFITILLVGVIMGLGVFLMEETAIGGKELILLYLLIAAGIAIYFAVYLLHCWPSYFSKRIHSTESITVNNIDE
jgi:hypothetical protein